MSRDAAPVLICDLDGTILCRNSFPLWVDYLIFGPLPELGFHAKAKLSFRTQQLLMRRKFGRIDHEELMRGIQQAWHASGGSASNPAARRFPMMLRRRVRPSLEPLLGQVTAGELDAVLATAAAGEYAIELGYRLGFRHVLTTPCRLAPDGRMNSGAQKLLRVARFLTAQYWAARPRVLLTDHIDDLPLMCHCDAVGWFGSADAMARAGGLAPGVRFIDCRRLDAAEMSLAIAELTAHARSRPVSASDASTPA